MIAQPIPRIECRPAPGAVAVAMSGGVDSSVAAALLREAGGEVFGLTMDLFRPPGGRCAEEGPPGCCGAGARRDAGAVAAALGMPFFTADFRRTFAANVIEDFVSEYRRGRTPNPCLRCNRFVKFGPLLRRAERLGAAALATGHYARVERDTGSGRWLLRKGVDPGKDQSYFLYSLPQDVLARTVFPVGGLRKTEVRALAEKMGLPVAHKPESQEICFVPGDDYAGFLRPLAPEAFRPGDIVDPEGRTIGRHDGIARYTVGQRKGLGIASPRPLYVVSVDAAANRITAGFGEALFSRRLRAEGVSWSAIAGLASSRPAWAKIRSRHAEARAILHPEEGGAVTVEFERAQRAVTPGQAVVFYEHDVVLGGGMIA